MCNKYIFLAVPTVLHLPPEQPSERFKRARRKSREKLVETLLQQHQKFPEALSDDFQRMSCSPGPGSTHNLDADNSLPSSIESELSCPDTEQKLEESLDISFIPDLCSTIIVSDEIDPDYNIKLLCDTVMKSTAHDLEISSEILEGSEAINRPEIQRGSGDSIISLPDQDQIICEIPEESERAESIIKPKASRGSVARLNTILQHQRQTIRNLRMQVNVIIKKSTIFFKFIFCILATEQGFTH